jgi:hypothetical protein
MKLYAGFFLLFLSCTVPLLGFWVATLSLPVAIKGAIIGLLTVGGPEILAIAAVALLGKEAFNMIAGKVLAALSRLAPQGSVGAARYKAGLLMFTLSFLPSYILAYAPQLIDDSWIRLSVIIAADIVFVVSLFVLGGDFWDKLRALFVYNARAQF